MNRVFIGLQKVGSVGGQGDFSGTVTDNYTDDIEVSFLADPSLLLQETHEIVRILTEKDGEALDVIEAALENGTAIYVNERPEMDHSAYKQMWSNPGISL